MHLISKVRTLLRKLGHLGCPHTFKKLSVGLGRSILRLGFGQGKVVTWYGGMLISPYGDTLLENF